MTGCMLPADDHWRLGRTVCTWTAPSSCTRPWPAGTAHEPSSDRATHCSAGSRDPAYRQPHPERAGRAPAALGDDITGANRPERYLAQVRMETNALALVSEINPKGPGKGGH